MSHPPPRSVYVHVPFCAKRCHYCDFSVARDASPPIDEFLATLARDLEQWFEDRGWSERAPWPLETLFVGGGTPSLLGTAGMAGLFRLLRRYYRWKRDDVEWTAEANPNSLTAEACEAWRGLGVNRLSIGVQSFQDEPLEWLGRLHDGSEAVAAVKRARRAGFDRINVDLIFGLPRDVRRDWEADVRQVVELGVTHVSAYGLTAEPRTPLGRRVERGTVRLPGGLRYAEEYRVVSDALRAEGFDHYEVSNFARPGHASRHNWHYWDGSDYLGVGPSAHSFLAGERIWNVFRWDLYRKAARAGASLRQGRERPAGDARLLERIWLGLRTREGLPGGDSAIALRPDVVAAWRRAGWVAPGDERLRLTPEGWLRLDSIAAEVAGWSEASVAPGRRRTTETEIGISL